MILVNFGEKISSEINSRVRSFVQCLESHEIAGVVEWVPAYCSLGVLYDPLQISYPQLLEELHILEAKFSESPTQKVQFIEIPVCYGGESGPDLGFVAEFNHLSPDDVVRLHTLGEYVVYFLGFTPGFPYLGGLPSKINAPRLDKPRPHVPPGSVAIGGQQTGIYPIASPGGWRIIGRTPLGLFKPQVDFPFLLRPGDRVKFRPISELEYAELKPSNEEGSRPTDERAFPAFLVKKPGLLSTIQDAGRYYYQCQGVSPCGAMDPVALQIGNILVGNPEDAAGLEITVSGPELQVLQPCQIAITGADLSAQLDGRALNGWMNHLLKAGQILSFGQRSLGARAYLCVEGGFAAEFMLESRSTDLNARFGGFQGRQLKKGDILQAKTVQEAGQSLPRREVSAECLEEYNDPFCLRVIPGPQTDCFDPGEAGKLYSNEFRVNLKSNRMGYLLDGPGIVAKTPEIISDPVPLGALQVLPDGRLVLLMADHQTVGGYPKMAVVITADIPKAAQLNIGDHIRFKAVNLETAHALLRAQASRIRRSVQIYERKIP
jgi:KipI family sensor histidine kinase inhibitor